MIRALLYLRSVSLRNRLTTSARRLRQPKYLVSFLAGIGYIYFFFLRRMHVMDGGRSTMAFYIAPETITIVGAAVLFFVLYAQTLYLVNGATPAARLRFSEAEIAFLFPAPLSRKRLIHFNLLGTQFKILFSSVILTLILGRWRSLGGSPLVHGIGWWLILSTFTLWGSAVTFLAARSIEALGPAVRRRALAALSIGAVLLISSIWRHAHPPASLNDRELPQSMAVYLQGWIQSSLGRPLLLPFAWVIAPFAAPTTAAFAKAFLPALVLPAACYAVVVFLEVPFREGSILSASRRQEHRMVRQATGGGPAGAVPKPRRAPFRLSGRGRPEIAFFWKNLIWIQSWFNLRIVVSLLVVATLVAANLLRSNHRAGATPGGPAGSPYAVVVLTLSVFAGIYIMLLGPQLVRQDLRNDLHNSDLLKTYPLPGWQIVFGEMLTSALVLAGLLWLAALAVGWSIFSGFPAAAHYSVGARLVFLGCIGVLIPPVVLLQLVIPNGAALLFPAWHQVTRSRSAGIEVIGQRLIFTFGQFVAVIIALAPAGVLAFLVGWSVSGWWSMLGFGGGLIAARLASATVAAMAVVLLEVAIGLWWLGTRFEAIDIATELKP